MLIKYPRTPHLPYSPGSGNEDRVLLNDERFINQEVIVMEKMDGENTTFYRNNIHARSINGYSLHPSRTLIKNIHSMISHRIPENVKICGENMVAKHSIHYKNLENYFYAFSVWLFADDNWHCLEHDYLVEYINNLNEYLGKRILKIAIPDILYKGIYDRELIKNLYVEIKENGDEMEGFVVRINKHFNNCDFDGYVAKYVRKDHVQTQEHWLNQEMIKNELKEI